MERAHVGFARAGYCRCDVYICDWDNKVLPALKKIGGSAEMCVGDRTVEVVADDAERFFRVGVYTWLFDDVKAKLKRV